MEHAASNEPAIPVSNGARAKAPASASPQDNVVPFNPGSTGDPPVPLGNLPGAPNDSRAQTKLEQKRQILFRAFELTREQLEKCAVEIATHAHLDEQPLNQRLDRCELAKSILVTCSFIQGVLLPQPPSTESQKSRQS